MERTLSKLLGTSLVSVVTEAGGCGADIDGEREYEAARQRFDEWHAEQRVRAEQLYGQLPAEAGGRPSQRISERE